MAQHHGCRPPSKDTEAVRVAAGSRERGGGVASRGHEAEVALVEGSAGVGPSVADGISITVHPLGHRSRSIRHVWPGLNRVAF